MTRIEVSVVLPVLDEVESLGVLHRELTEVLTRLGRPYEILFIDDGSRDGSFERIEKIALEDERVRAVQLRRNFGKAAALAVGFREAQGDLIVTLDADLQDDPAEVPKLLNRLEDGFDLVSGWKQERQDPRSKTWPSRLFNRVTGVPDRSPPPRLQLRLQDLPARGGAGDPAVRGAPPVHPGAGRLARVPDLRGAGAPSTPAVRSIQVRLGSPLARVPRPPDRAVPDPLHAAAAPSLRRARPDRVDGRIRGERVPHRRSGWSGAQPIGTRPLLAFGVLSMLLGVQFFAVGLLSELVLSYQTRSADDVSIRRRLE